MNEIQGQERTSFTVGSIPINFSDKFMFHFSINDIRINFNQLLFKVIVSYRVKH